jgi:signal transduction histidine kinase
MSHELRTPLNTINGFLEILLDGLAGPLSERQREFLAYAHTSTRRLTQLLDQMVLLSRPAHSRSLLYRMPTDLQSILASARATHAEAASARGVLLTYEVPGTLPTIRADEARLAQAFAYLLGWALARTPAGGTVTLRAGQRTKDVTIEIEDSGSPIARAALPRLFEPFCPPPDAAAPPTTTGLELAVAHRIVSLHNGELRASQRPDGGVRLRITLPNPDGIPTPASPAS